MFSPITGFSRHSDEIPRQGKGKSPIKYGETETVAMMFAADHLSKGDFCEGSMPEITIKPVTQALNILASRYPQSQKIHDLKDSFENAQKLAAISILRGKASKLHETIHKTSEGKYFSFPISFDNHCMMIEFERNSDKTFNVRVYNGGYRRRDYHPMDTFIDPNTFETRINTQLFLELRNVPEGNITKKFVERLLYEGRSIKYLYEKILPMLGVSIHVRSSDPRHWSKGQEGKCCTSFSLMAVPKSKLDKAEYQELKLIIRESLFQKYWSSKIAQRNHRAFQFISLEMIKKIEKVATKLNQTLRADLDLIKKDLEKSLEGTKPKNATKLSFADNLSEMLDAFDRADLHAARVHLEAIYTSYSNNRERPHLGESELRSLKSLAGRLLKFANTIGSEEGDNPALFVREAYDLCAGLTFLIRESSVDGSIDESLKRGYREFGKDFHCAAKADYIFLKLKLGTYQSSPGHQSPWTRMLFKSDFFKMTVAKIFDNRNAFENYRKKFNSQISAERT